ncbi:hypothetical protein SRU_2714 [Salinibacter ruber DSM 13855]|uniref:Uncharacterized protein n=1 Tax=Salinibacter ruber (strain DSM 13855 / M31) TaxID=309807 RepID=Q2RZ25_SALRD|nr:hypothetical protein SRU_2714 [Salinibacter ruber DSM 13855]
MGQNDAVADARQVVLKAGGTGGGGNERRSQRPALVGPPVAVKAVVVVGRIAPRRRLYELGVLARHAEVLPQHGSHEGRRVRAAKAYAPEAVLGTAKSEAVDVLVVEFPVHPAVEAAEVQVEAQVVGGEVVGVGAHVENVLFAQHGAQPVADRHRLFAPTGVRAAPLGVVHESDVDLKGSVWREGAEIQRLFVEERIADEPLASEPSVGQVALQGHVGTGARNWHVAVGREGDLGDRRGVFAPGDAPERQTRGHAPNHLLPAAHGELDGPVPKPAVQLGRMCRRRLGGPPHELGPECVGEPTVLKGAADGKPEPHVGGGGVDHPIPVGGEPEGEGGARSSRRKDRRGVPHGVAAGLGPALRYGDAPREDEQTDPAHDRPVRREHGNDGSMVEQSSRLRAAPTRHGLLATRIHLLIRWAVGGRRSGSTDVRRHPLHGCADRATRFVPGPRPRGAGSRPRTSPPRRLETAC